MGVGIAAGRAAGGEGRRGSEGGRRRGRERKKAGDGGEGAWVGDGGEGAREGRSSGWEMEGSLRGEGGEGARVGAWEGLGSSLTHGPDPTGHRAGPHPRRSASNSLPPARPSPARQPCPARHLRCGVGRYRYLGAENTRDVR